MSRSPSDPKHTFADIAVRAGEQRKHELLSALRLLHTFDSDPEAYAIGLRNLRRLLNAPDAEEVELRERAHKAIDACVPAVLWWAPKYKLRACKSCNESTRKHRGLGLCVQCYGIDSRIAAKTKRYA